MEILHDISGYIEILQDMSVYMEILQYILQTTG